MRVHYRLTIAVAAVLTAACNTGQDVSNSRTIGSNANSAVEASNAAGHTRPGDANHVATSAANAVQPATPANDFMMEAAYGGLAEVEMGKLATRKAASPEVKRFAEMMIADHTRTNEELKAIATQKGVAVPTTPDPLHRSMMEDMTNLSGSEFDRRYVNAMVDDHQRTVDRFQRQADAGTDADVKAFAARTLPILRQHLEAIRNIQANLK
jgi:putative membrane protein